MIFTQEAAMHFFKIKSYLELAKNGNNIRRS